MAGTPSVLFVSSDLNSELQKGRTTKGHLRMLAGLPKAHHKTPLELVIAAKNALRRVNSTDVKIEYVDAKEATCTFKLDGKPVTKADEFKAMLRRLGIRQAEDAIAAAFSDPRSSRSTAVAAPEPSDPMEAMQAMMQGFQEAMSGASRPPVLRAEATDGDADAVMPFNPQAANPFMQMMENQEKISARVTHELGMNGPQDVDKGLETAVKGVKAVHGAATTFTGFVNKATEKTAQVKATVRRNAHGIKVMTAAAAGLGSAVVIGLAKQAFESAVESLGWPGFLTLAAAVGGSTYVALNKAEAKVQAATGPAAE